jgi:hypothetical protein
VSDYTYSPPKAEWPEDKDNKCKPIVELNVAHGLNSVVLAFPDGLIPRWTGAMRRAPP